MTVKKSIKSLESLKLKIPADERTEELWLIQTSSLIESFFGIESKEFKFIDNFNFKNSIVRQTDFIYKGYSGDTVGLNTDYKVIASQFLDNCIETIKTKGLYIRPSDGIFKILFSSKNWYLTSFFIGIIYAAGILTATINKTDRKENSSDGVIITSDSITNKKTNTEPKIANTDSINK